MRKNDQTLLRDKKIMNINLKYGRSFYSKQNLTYKNLMEKIKGP